MRQEGLEASDVHEEVWRIVEDNPQSQHSPQNQQEKPVSGLSEGDKTPCAGAKLGDGPKRSANRGWSDFDGKFVVAKQNRRVLCPPDMARLPNRRIRDHGSPGLKAQRHVHPRNPPRRSGTDPRRPDLGDQWICCT